MKIGNIQFHDEQIHGGLSAGSKLDKQIWDAYGNKPEEVRVIAELIRTQSSEVKAGDIFDMEACEEFPEGRIVEKLHKKLERNGGAPKRKKERILKEKGKLVCEGCGFDFSVVYGQLGYGFAECHHRVPLFSLGGLSTTKLSDLAIVCSNCHRMLHRKRPWMTVDELSNIVQNESRKGNQR